MRRTRSAPAWSPPSRPPAESAAKQDAPADVRLRPVGEARDDAELQLANAPQPPHGACRRPDLEAALHRRGGDVARGDQGEPALAGSPGEQVDVQVTPLRATNVCGEAASPERAQANLAARGREDGPLAGAGPS